MWMVYVNAYADCVFEFAYMHKQKLEAESKNEKSANFLFLMPFKWMEQVEKQQHINNVAEQQIKKQVKQMKTESLYNLYQPVQRVCVQVNSKKTHTYSIMLMIIGVLHRRTQIKCIAKA